MGQHQDVSRIIKNQKDLEDESKRLGIDIVDIVNKNFWDLLEKTESMNYEYNIVTLILENGDTKGLHNHMNRYGSEGWDIFQVEKLKDDIEQEIHTLYMKRVVVTTKTKC